MNSEPLPSSAEATGNSSLESTAKAVSDLQQEVPRDIQNALTEKDQPEGRAGMSMAELKALAERYSFASSCAFINGIEMGDLLFGELKSQSSGVAIVQKYNELVQAAGVNLQKCINDLSVVLKEDEQRSPMVDPFNVIEDADGLYQRLFSESTALRAAIGRYIDLQFMRRNIFFTLEKLLAPEALRSIGL